MALLIEKLTSEVIDRLRVSCERKGAHAKFIIGNEGQGYWKGSHNLSIEKVCYESNKFFLGQRILKIEYEGWRRHLPERRSTEGIRLLFFVSSLAAQADLARRIDTKPFQKIAWLEPLVADPSMLFVALNFRESLIESHPTYLDELFERLGTFESLPPELIDDIKRTIAYNCLHNFFRSLLVTDITKAQVHIRPTALVHVDSPFYLAAKLCAEQSMLSQARSILKNLGKEHWQYEEAITFERQVVEQEIHSLQETIARMHWRELYPNFLLEKESAYTKRPQYPSGLTPHSGKLMTHDASLEPLSNFLKVQFSSDKRTNLQLVNNNLVQLRPT